MKDPRIDQLAHNLIFYSCRVKPGDKVLIEATGQHFELVNALVAAAYEAKALPFVWLREASTQRALLMGMTQEQMEFTAQRDAEFMSQMDAYIGLRGGDNASEMNDVPGEQTRAYTKIYSARVHSGIRVPKTHWCVLRYPSPSMAQMADMSTEAFEDYYFNVCNLDYSKMSRAMDALKALMERTDRVRITGPGTDLSFSIKGIPAVKCDGLCNIPDGEIYTAPVRESVNGRITYNTPALYQSNTFEGISFTFENGRIIESSANLPEQLEAVLNTDEGARYIGEFSFGVNPYINVPMKDTLFDEKIAGSIHLTPGNCYDEAPNGNHSAIHWDLVLVQTPAYGGGEIYFDDVLIRKDGRFVLPELECLNPENLM